MKSNSIFPFMILSALSITSVRAQFTLSAEIRPRTEYRHGYQTLIDSSQHAGIFTSQRTRVNFGYQTDKLKTGLSVQDVRTWGNQSQANGYDVNTYSLIEAWGEYNLNDKFSLKAGRQPFVYNDERLLGNAAWVQQGRSHDALLFKYSDSTFFIHLAAAYNQDSEKSIASPYTIQNNYKELYFIWISKTIGKFNISLLELNNGFQSTASINSTRFSYTTGTHIEYKDTKNIIGNAKFYYQSGVSASKKDISAWMSGVDLLYPLSAELAVGAGVGIYSGQSQTDTSGSYRDISHNFNTLYGTGHKFEGNMDYFFAGGGHGNVGLNSFSLKMKFNKEKWWFELALYEFLSGADVLDNDKLLNTGEYSSMNKVLGTEADFTFLYAFSKAFNIQVGYSHFFATKTMEALKGGDYKETQNWAYLMLTFKPRLVN